jgi:hypothetical protein
MPPLKTAGPSQVSWLWLLRFQDRLPLEPVRGGELFHAPGLAAAQGLSPINPAVA